MIMILAFLSVQMQQKSCFNCQNQKRLFWSLSIVSTICLVHLMHLLFLTQSCVVHVLYFPIHNVGPDRNRDLVEGVSGEG